MKTGRIAFVHSTRAIEWQSCRVITSNLARAYQEAFPHNSRFFSCGEWKKPSDIQKTVEQIYRYRPERLVFLDHTPHPSAILGSLKALYRESRLPLLTFHLYGDFTLNTREWLQSAPLLNGTRASFVCASEAQKDLVSRFLLNPRGRAVYIPFPVNSNIYRDQPAQRQNWRKKLGVRPDEILVVYAGRISLQKNNLRALDALFRIPKSSGMKLRMVFAGTFDDMGAQFFGIPKQKKGTSGRNWRAYLARLTPGERNMIRHVGQLGSKDLLGIYNAADAYLSLSLHHDEDFGMAAAEALCSGTPCILTAWGGHTSFALSQGNVDGCAFVPIRLKRRGIEIDLSYLQRSFLNLSAAQHSRPEARRRRSEAYLKRFSIETVASQLKRLHERPVPEFRGFSRLMRRHAEGLEHPPLFPHGPEAGGLYEDIYGSYLKNRGARVSRFSARVVC